MMGISTLMAGAVPSDAETILSSEHRSDFSGYSCGLSLIGESGSKLSINLGHHDDEWSLTFFVSGMPDLFKAYFRETGLQDNDLVDRAFPTIAVGRTDFKVSDASLNTIEQKDLGPSSTLIFKVKLLHKVVHLLNKMEDGGIRVGPLLYYSDLAASSVDFRECAYEALELVPGKEVEDDFRGEIRLIFEEAFVRWIAAMEQSISCGTGSASGDEISNAIDRAAEAFYPGITNYFARKRYEEKLRENIALAELAGMADAATNRCSMSSTLVDVTRMTVDTAIDGAATMD